jgi:hypothetical protein
VEATLGPRQTDNINLPTPSLTDCIKAKRALDILEKLITLTGGRLTENQLIEIVIFQLIESFNN